MKHSSIDATHLTRTTAPTYDLHLASYVLMGHVDTMEASRIQSPAKPKGKAPLIILTPADTLNFYRACTDLLFTYTNYTQFT